MSPVSNFQVSPRSQEPKMLRGANVEVNPCFCLYNTLPFFLVFHPGLQIQSLTIFLYCISPLRPAPVMHMTFGFESQICTWEDPFLTVCLRIKSVFVKKIISCPHSGICLLPCYAIVTALLACTTSTSLASLGLIRL